MGFIICNFYHAIYQSPNTTHNFSSLHQATVFNITSDHIWPHKPQEKCQVYSGGKCGQCGTTLDWQAAICHGNLCSFVFCIQSLQNGSMEAFNFWFWRTSSYNPWLQSLLCKYLLYRITQDRQTFDSFGFSCSLMDEQLGYCWTYNRL